MKKLLFIASFLGYGFMSAQVAAPQTSSFSEGFEDGIPATWSVQNLSVPIGTNVDCWNSFTESLPWDPQAGPAQVGANFNCTAGAGTISGWLFGPEIMFNNGDKIKFWTRIATGGGSFPDRLELRLSKNGASVNAGTTATSVGDFSTVLLSVNPDLTTTGYPEVFTEYTATISGLGAPVNGRIAFRYFVTDGGPAGSNSNILSVDTFSYTNSTLAVNNAANSKMAVYPNPTSDYLHFNGKVSSVQVFDATGKIVKVEVVNNIADVRNLAKGIYFVRYSTETGTEMQKFIKK